MTTPCTFLSRAAFDAREEARRGAIEAWRAAHPGVEGWPQELSDLNKSFFVPGTMWECWWYFDPTDPNDSANGERWLRELEQNPAADRYLSVHYLRDWAKTRPPICVVCPGGSQWVIDAKSSNGTGWVVTGQAPLITCTPSIVVPGYHGFLTAGVFTDPV